MPERRPSQRRFALGLCASVAAFGLACSTDTAGLERREPSAGAGGGSAGNGGGAAAGAAGEAGAAGAGGSAGQPEEEPGTGAVHVVNGLLDGGALFVCLRDVATAAAIVDDAPLPEAGVPYGGSLRIPTSWDLTLDIDALLFVAPPSSLAGTSCTELIQSTAPVAPPTDAGVDAVEVGDAGGPPPPPFPSPLLAPRVVGAVRFAPGLVRAGASYALAAAGCTSPAPRADVCGDADVVFGSSSSLLLVGLARPSRAGGGTFGLQFLNASRALSRADVVLQGETDGQTVQLTNSVQFGSVRPLDAAQVLEPIGVELHVDGETQSRYTQPWSDTLAAGVSAVAPGSNYLLAYVGPLPGEVAEGVAGPRFVLVGGP